MDTELLFKGTEPDIIFIIDKNKIFAHKSVLSQGSPVFDTQFNGSLPFKDKELHVLDVTEECFKEVLNFLYTAKCVFTETNICGILVAADKYLIKKLVNQCFNYMEEILTVENIFNFIETCKLVPDSDQLFQKCLEFIQENTKQFFENEFYEELTKNQLKIILQQDRMNFKEIELFEGVILWTTQQCADQDIEETNLNKRIMLDDLFYLLRFPTMNEEDFVSCTSNVDLFTADEIENLNRYRTKNEKLNLKFSCKPRKYATIYYKLFEFYQGSQLTSKAVQKNHKILDYSPIFFRVDNPTEILGCEVQFQCPENLMLVIKLIVNGSVEDVNKKKILSPIFQRHLVFFKNSIQIKPKIIYELHATLILVSPKNTEPDYTITTTYMCGSNPKTTFQVNDVNFEIIKIGSVNPFISFVNSN